MKHQPLIVTGVLFVAAQVSFCQEPADAEPNAGQAQELLDKFEKALNKSSLVGHFIVDGTEDDQRKKERYDISRIQKLPKGDFWLFYARIAYGDHDVTVPVPVEVKWAGTTPVITVDNVTIPALGTFDARVLISDNRYAGTWRHGKVGGLMFGHIEKQKKEDGDTE